MPMTWPALTPHKDPVFADRKGGVKCESNHLSHDEFVIREARTDGLISKW